MADPGRHEIAPEPGPGRGRLVSRALTVLLIVALVALISVVIVRPSFRPGLVGVASAGDRVEVSGKTIVVTRIPPHGSTIHARAQEQLIAAVIDDLTTFWAGALPTATGDRFVALRGGLTAMDSSAATGSAPCVGSPGHIVGNAYYCPPSDGIIYDSSALVPVLLHRYSIGGVIATFAHEFGHAVQAQVRSSASEADAPPPGSLTTEAQADCDAGAFLSWVVAGEAHHISMGPDMLAAAIGPIVDFSDPVTVSPSDPTAHGLAVDRLQWLLTGFTEGAAACVAITDVTLDAMLGTVPVPADSAERYSSRQALLSAAERSIEQFQPGSPTGAADPAQLDAAGESGQFAQATVLALAIGEKIYGSASAAACFAGAWTGSVYGSAGPGELGSWPGDADEALAAVRRVPGVDFEQIANFSDGFRSGLSHCS